MSQSYRATHPEMFSEAPEEAATGWEIDPTPVPRDDVHDTLAERGARYGQFSSHAQITQDLKLVMNSAVNWPLLSNSHKEALEMIAHKIGRILNGDPNYDDSWRDIAGYATLIVKQLHGEDL